MPEENLSKTVYDLACDTFAAATSAAGYRTACCQAYQACYAHLAKHAFLVGYEWQMTGADHGGMIRHLMRHEHPDAQSAAHEMRALKTLRKKAFYNLDSPFTKGMAENAIERAYAIIYEFAK